MLAIAAWKLCGHNLFAELFQRQEFIQGVIFSFSETISGALVVAYNIKDVMQI